MGKKKNLISHTRVETLVETKTQKEKKKA